MNLLPRILIFAFSVAFIANSFAAATERIELWNKHAPVGDGTFTEEETWLTVHRPGKPNGTGVIICPGGGYRGLVTGAEGHGIAKWLNKHGITGVVLEYRLPKGRAYVPLLDAQQAIRHVRAKAKKWKLNPKRIGIMGFSAGGHLASTAGTYFDLGDKQAKERLGNRPDFMILVYPVISFGTQGHRGSRDNLLGKAASDELIRRFSNHLQVSPNTPPAYLAHAVDDKPVPPANSRMFHSAMKDAGRPCTYLELPNGGHGLNGYKGPNWDAWQAGSIRWLLELDLIPQ
ncbi:MAG: alpha/beta hydrolase [Verrucomicrobiales bacterium]|nr:alpha/beta hydrolase [Verrucomicrobiales bacterium]|tara:strand:- start:225 stop:1085 length:861 start_codon:yes stop_codon:yes gene_type:complete